MTRVKRNTQLHALWREAALATKPHICECCGESEDTTVIQVHHVLEFKDHPEIGYCVENSAILCCRCHAHIHSGRPELIKPVEDKLAENTDRVLWIQEHLDVPCPDYGNKDIVMALREKLWSLIPHEYDTYGRVYYITNRLRHIETGKAWYRAHKKESNEKTKAYYIAHRDEMRKISHDLYMKHREEVLKRTKEYAAARREKYREYQRDYRAKHRDRINEAKRLSRARAKEQKKLEAANVS